MRSFKLSFLYIVISLFALALEASFIGFPFTFFIASFMLVIVKRVNIYILAFLNAFIIDSLRVSNFGLTPLFLLAEIFAILIYERYSGSKDILIATIVIVVTGFIYSHFMGYSLSSVIVFYVVSFALFISLIFLKRSKLLSI